MSDPLTMLADLAARMADLEAEVATLRAERTPPSRWLSIKAAAEYLDCSEGAVRERVRKGRIPAYAVRHSGARVYIDRQLLDDSLASTH